MYRFLQTHLDFSPKKNEKNQIKLNFTLESISFMFNYLIPVFELTKVEQKKIHIFVSYLFVL